MQTLHTCEILYSPDLKSPLVDTAVLVDADGTILSAGRTASMSNDGDERIDHQILMPGVVNAHVHLTDAGRREVVPGGEGLAPWVARLMGTRDAGLSPDERRNAIRTTLDEMKSTGTVAAGEVVNDQLTLDAVRESGMRCRLIHELIAFRLDRVDAAIAESERMVDENRWNGPVRHALGAHAPYSVAPSLMHSIVEWSRRAGTHVYQHLAEDPDERELYERGTGRWREFMMNIGAWEDSWKPPGLAPIPYYDRLGFLDRNFVAVHLADASADEIELLGRRGVKVVLSPRSNLHITGLFPDVRTMVRAEMTLAFGTDGRGSSPSMNVFDEATVVLDRLPDLPAGTLLRALTLGGAEVLGFDELGRIRPGRSPGLISVNVNGAVSPDLRTLERVILADAPERRRVV